MTPQIALTLGIIAGALVLFGTDKLRVDVVALLVLLTVALTGLVGPEEVFEGFSNPAVITVWAVYIVSGGMYKTGVATILGKFIIRLSGENEMRLILVIMLTCGIISAFMNNVGATAMLLPAVIRSAAAVSGPMPENSISAGANTVVSRASSAFRASISRVSWM